MRSVHKKSLRDFPLLRHLFHKCRSKSNSFGIWYRLHAAAQSRTTRLAPCGRFPPRGGYFARLRRGFKCAITFCTTHDFRHRHGVEFSSQFRVTWLSTRFDRDEILRTQLRGKCSAKPYRELTNLLLTLMLQLRFLFETFTVFKSGYREGLIRISRKIFS